MFISESVSCETTGWGYPHPVLIGVHMAHHKYKVLVLVKDRQTGDIDTYEKTYVSKRDMKRDIALKYYVKRLSLVTPELYQGVSVRYEVSIFVSYQY